MEDFRKKLGQHAKELRKKAKKTQAEVAKEVGIYPPDLSAFEKHGNKLGLDKISAIFDCLGYELEPVEKKTTLICA